MSSLQIGANQYYNEFFHMEIIMTFDSSPIFQLPLPKPYN